MNLTLLTHKEVEVRVEAEPEFMSVEGNACVSGDDALDREVEHNIHCRIQQRDVWAWAAVTVTVSWGAFSSSSHLGCCSYADENNFREEGGYFHDMVDEALAELNNEVLSAYRKIKEREQAA